MSDSRFHLKATFQIYGQSFDWDCSLNWSAESGYIDQRIYDWLLECHDKAYRDYESKSEEESLARRQQAVVSADLNKIAELKTKYPNLF